jgi:hypothetical protein
MLPRRSRAADLNRLNSELLSYFGVSVVLPDGREVVGVFARLAPPPNPWPETGAVLDITRARNPEVSLPTADAAGLTKNAALLIDGERFLVVELDPPSEGQVRIPLIPEPVGTARPAPVNRWQ